MKQKQKIAFAVMTTTIIILILFLLLVSIMYLMMNEFFLAIMEAAPAIGLAYVLWLMWDDMFH